MDSTITLYSIHEGLMCATSEPLKDNVHNNTLALQQQLLFNSEGIKAWVVYNNLNKTDD